MRRKDRQMDEEFARYVIEKSEYGNLSVVDCNNNPHIVALSLVIDDNNLYFHSAKEGLKTRLLEDGKNVCISFITDVKVPDNYTNEELDIIVKDQSKTKVLISSVFTTEFASTIVYGRVYLVENYDEKVKAMRLICEKYTKEKMDYFEKAIEFGMKRTNVYKVEIDEMTSKRKKYNENKEELKWQKKI